MRVSKTGSQQGSTSVCTQASWVHLAPGQGPNIPSDRLSGVCGAHLSQGSTVAICRFWKPALVSVFACFFAVTSLGHYGHSKPLFTGSNAPGVI
jgi:hypothetical protein